MANQFYTPSPMVNFQYQPNRSEPQRMMDTMKEIKTEQREDEKFAIDKKNAELQYQTGILNLQAAEAKMTKIQKEEQLDMEAGQMFNSLTATGTPPSEAFKMVGNHYLTKGGYSAYQKFQEEQNSLIKDAFSMGKDNPAAFGFVSDILKSRGVDVSPEQMQQQWSLGKTVSIGDGRFASPQADGSWTITDQATPEMRQIRAAEMELKQAKVAQEWEKIRLEKNAPSRQAAAEAKAIERLAAEERKVARQQIGAQFRSIESDANAIESTKRRLATAKKDELAALVASMSGGQITPDSENPGYNTALVEEFLNGMKKTIRDKTKAMEQVFGEDAKREVALIKSNYPELFEQTPATDQPNPDEADPGKKTPPPPETTEQRIARQNREKKKGAAALSKIAPPSTQQQSR